MNPSVKDRLASIVRALNGVVLPALPKEASLAQEQVMLAMGHIQIILAQLDATPDYLAEEAADLAQMGMDVAAAATGGTDTIDAVARLRASLAAPDATGPEARTATIQTAIDDVLQSMAKDGDPVAQASVRTIILEQGAARAEKDRRWFAAMGFDIDYSAA